MTGRQGRRHRQQQLDYLKKTRGYWKLKEEVSDRTLWRTRFGTGYEPVARQTTELINQLINCGLFNDAVRRSDHTAFNGMMICE